MADDAQATAGEALPQLPPPLPPSALSTLHGSMAPANLPDQWAPERGANTEWL